jgi:hypothetical protein
VVANQVNSSTGPPNTIVTQHQPMVDLLSWLHEVWTRRQNQPCQVSFEVTILHQIIKNDTKQKRNQDQISRYCVTTLLLRQKPNDGIITEFTRSLNYRDCILLSICR